MKLSPWVSLCAALLVVTSCDDKPKTAVASSAPVEAVAAAVEAKPTPQAPPVDDAAPTPEARSAPEPARKLTAADIISDDQGDEPEERAADVAAEGVLLPGKDGLPIMKVSLVRHIVASKHYDKGDIVLDRVKATLSPTASVDEVNEALEETGARVCELTRPQIPFRVKLCIPLQKTRADVQAVADELKGFSSVVHAAPYRGAPANATRAHVE